eukprot:TRINITY_DN61936_c0_g1_i1.p1 TRINITY_DN61936_c0_g1~~TRINITY_DN61936_c0_g1_i1.p1  ORF type:complete len:393 (+),score=62.07 TRINITY_DN61936_c0_g1_i1:31-1209(+)
MVFAGESCEPHAATRSLIGRARGHRIAVKVTAVAAALASTVLKGCSSPGCTSQAVPNGTVGFASPGAVGHVECQEGFVPSLLASQLRCVEMEQRCLTASSQNCEAVYTFATVEMGSLGGDSRPSHETALALCVPVEDSHTCLAQQIENGIVEAANMTDHVIVSCAPGFFSTPLVESIRCSPAGFRLLLEEEAPAKPQVSNASTTSPAKQQQLESVVGATSSPSPLSDRPDDALKPTPANSESTSSAVEPTTETTSTTWSTSTFSVGGMDAVGGVDVETATKAHQELVERRLARHAVSSAAHGSLSHSLAHNLRDWSKLLGGPNRAIPWSGFCSSDAASTVKHLQLDSISARGAKAHLARSGTFSGMHAPDLAQAASVVAILISLCVVLPWIL